MKQDEQRRIVEALILAAEEPVPATRIAEIVPGLSTKGARELVEALRREYESQGRGFELWEVAGGYQLRTRPDLSGWVKQLAKDRPLRLSRAALETLAVVAYKQPVTRAEVEHVRGVDVGPVLRSLLDRKLVRIAGHREVPGRPILYGTTKRFLEVFGLKRIEDLPTLRDVEELMREHVELEGDDEAGAEGGGESGSGPGPATSLAAELASGGALHDPPGELH